MATSSNRGSQFLLAAIAVLVGALATQPALAQTNCASAVAGFRSILEQDIQMGRVDKSVYDKATAELGNADAACRAGRDAAAVEAVRATKRRYGYPQ